MQQIQYTNLCFSSLGYPYHATVINILGTIINANQGLDLQDELYCPYRARMVPGWLNVIVSAL